MPGTPLVTVLMPVFDTPATYLDAAFASVLEQSFTDFELLVVDDGSGQETRARLANWADRDGRVRVLRNPTNRGISDALNLGLSAARGRLLARQDADDISLPQRLERQVRFFDAHADHVLTGTQCALVDACGRPYTIDGRGWEEWQLLLISLVRTPIVHSSAMLRLGPLREHGLWYAENVLAGEDYDLWVRLLAHGRMAVLPEVLVLYRQHQGSISQRERAEQRANLRTVALRHCRQRLSLPEAEWGKVERFFLLLYPQEGRPPTPGEVAAACDGARILIDGFSAAYGLTPRQRFQARRLGVRWLAMGLVRSGAWRHPSRLAPLLSRGFGLAGPGAAEVADFTLRRLRGRAFAKSAGAPPCRS